MTLCIKRLSLFLGEKQREFTSYWEILSVKYDCVFVVVVLAVAVPWAGGGSYVVSEKDTAPNMKLCVLLKT